MSFHPKDLLRQLVQIDSVNPDFGDHPAGEARLTDFLQQFVQSQGWPWLRQTVHPGRDNLVVLVGGDLASAEHDGVSGTVSLWDVHQDTVGVAGMRIEPFAAAEQEGRIYGRGACDIKGGMAAMLAALAADSAGPVATAGPIFLAFTINEESGFTGAKALCRLWADDVPLDELANETRGTLNVDLARSLPPQRVLVAEPTLLDVVVTHKGIVRWRCHTRGRAAHSSQPDLGTNAVYSMASVVEAVCRYDQEVLRKREIDPRCGRPTCCVTTIRGGAGANTVPDHVVIDIDRRLLPSEDPEDAYQEAVDYITAGVGTNTEAEHEPPWNVSSGLSAESNSAWATQVASVVRGMGRPSELAGVPFGTNAWVYSGHGYPTVVFGPGSIDQAHTDDEWLAIEQLEAATEALRQLAIGAHRPTS